MRVSTKVAVIVFPGSQDDRDAAWALGSVGAEPALLWHAEHELPRGTGAVVLPGGFSHGDYLRCAPPRASRRRWRRSRASPPRAARCSASATASRSLRGRVAARRAAPEPPARVRLPGRTVRVERADTPSRAVARPGRSSSFPSSTARAAGSPARRAGPARGERAGRPALCRGRERLARPGRRRAQRRGNVLGLMPHPSTPWIPARSADGALILASLVDAARERLFAAA